MTCNNMPEAVKTPYLYRKMRFSVESSNSYNSIHPTYYYTEQFSNNIQNYHEGTNWVGIFLAFLSGTFFTISSALVKGIKNVDPMILLVIRAIMQIAIMIILVCKEAKSFIGPKGYRILIQFQGLVGGMTLCLLYYSFRKLPLGDTTTIIFSSPVIVIALSYLFLKEPCGVLRVTVICTLFAGVVLIAQPPFIFQIYKKEPYDVVGYMCALLATFFTALNIVITKKCSEIHYSVIVFNLSTWSLISAVIFFIFVPYNQEPFYHIHHRFTLPKEWFTWEMIMIVAVTGMSGQVLIAKALKLEGAGKVSVTRSLDIILAYLIQIYFFNEIPSKSSLVGALLILFSVFCMGFEKEIYGVCDYIP